MNKERHMTNDQEVREKALQEVLKKYRKMLRRTSEKEWKELDEEIYATTRVTLDNLTSDDL